MRRYGHRTESADDLPQLIDHAKPPAHPPDADKREWFPIPLVVQRIQNVLQNSWISEVILRCHDDISIGTCHLLDEGTDAIRLRIHLPFSLPERPEGQINWIEESRFDALARRHLCNNVARDVNALPTFTDGP